VEYMLLLFTIKQLGMSLFVHVSNLKRYDISSAASYSTVQSFLSVLPYIILFCSANRELLGYIKWAIFTISVANGLGLSIGTSTKYGTSLLETLRAAVVSVLIRKYSA